jgi:hypothetical protein
MSSTNAVSTYKNFKQQLYFADRWRKLIGSPFSGGGGGVGYVIKSSCSMEIYHQEYHGAKNYHESGSFLDGYLAKAVTKLQSSIFDVAWEMMNTDLAVAAKDAHNELKKAAEDAGLE